MKRAVAVLAFVTLVVGAALFVRGKQKRLKAYYTGGH